MRLRPGQSLWCGSGSWGEHGEASFRVRSCTIFSLQHGPNNDQDAGGDDANQRRERAPYAGRRLERRVASCCAATGTRSPWRKSSHDEKPTKIRSHPGRRPGAVPRQVWQRRPARRTTAPTAAPPSVRPCRRARHSLRLPRLALRHRGNVLETPPERNDAIIKHVKQPRIPFRSSWAVLGVPRARCRRR